MHRTHHRLATVEPVGALARASATGNLTDIAPRRHSRLFVSEAAQLGTGLKGGPLETLAGVAVLMNRKTKNEAR